MDLTPLLVKQKQVELNAAIVASGEVKLLASMMNLAGLMSDGHHDDITAVETWLTDRERARSIVRILLRSTVKNLEKFKDILRSKSEFKDILQVLEATAGKPANWPDNQSSQISEDRISEVPLYLLLAGAILLTGVLIATTVIILASKATAPALYIASKNGQVEVAKSILERGAQINLKTNDGTSALHIASQNGHVDVAKLLLEKGAKVDLLNNDQCSSLMIACEHGQTAVTQVLLDHDADTYLRNKKNQTALEIAKENNYVDIISLFAELKEKAAYPGILFSEGIKKESITSDEKTINLENVGISITFPENSLPSTDPPLEITIQPCFSGSFEMPDGIESVSPAYIIKYNQKITFLKHVILKIRHYANLQTKEDCENMVFLSASSTPEYRGSTPVYVFREITDTKGLFRPRQEKPLGEIQLKHFSIIAIGIKLPNWIVALFFSKLYSARLFKTETSAIFCMCLYQPEYMQQCEKVIASKYTGIQEPIDCSGVTLSSNEVAIRASENIEWKVFFQKNKILRTEIATQEVYQDNFKELLKLNYPPRIGVTLTPLTPNPEPLKLFVEGLNEECTFNLLPDHYVPECAIPSQDLPHSSVNTQGLSVQKEPSTGPSTQPIREEPSTGPSTQPIREEPSTGPSTQEELSTGPSTQPIHEEPSACPSTTPTEPRKVKQPNGHRIKNLKDLISATEEFGDWYGLCLSLKVEQAVMNQLDDSTERPVQKMRRCLTNYFNNQIPSWDDVVRAIAELHNKRLACRIATEHMQWEEKDCKVELNM